MDDHSLWRSMSRRRTSWVLSWAYSTNPPTRHHLHTSPIYDLKKLPRGQKTCNPNWKMNLGQLPSRVDTAIQISAVRACLFMPNQISKISGEFTEFKVNSNSVWGTMISI